MADESLEASLPAARQVLVLLVGARLCATDIQRPGLTAAIVMGATFGYVLWPARVSPIRMIDDISRAACPQNYRAWHTRLPGQRFFLRALRMALRLALSRFLEDLGAAGGSLSASKLKPSPGKGLPSIDRMKDSMPSLDPMS